MQKFQAWGAVHYPKFEVYEGLTTHKMISRLCKGLEAEYSSDVDLPETEMPLKTSELLTNNSSNLQKELLKIEERNQPNFNKLVE